MNWSSIPFRRLLWTIPATLAGAITFIACIFAVGSMLGGHPGALIRFTLLIHAIAWMLFIVPFAWVVPETSKLYRFPISALWGALFGGAACFIFAMGLRILLGLPTRMALDTALEFAPLCAASGAAVAAVMSQARMRGVSTATAQGALEGK